MQRKSLGTAMRYLVIVCALISAFVMVGCGGGGEEGGPTVTSGETVPNVDTGTQPVSSSSVQALEGQTFALPGSAFDPSLAGTQQLAFTGPGTLPNSEAFDLSPNGGGDTTFGSCTFIFRRGPLSGKSVRFNNCNIRITSGAATAGGGLVNANLTFTLSGGPFDDASITITVQIRISSDGNLLIGNRPIGIIISSNGTPTTTGTTGAGGQ